jgi:hypothetical protein
MQITILNGNKKPDNSIFTDYLESIAQKLGESHKVNHFNLLQMNLKQCTGCWSCWWKTPGLCAIKDDAEPIMRSIVYSDLLVFASPIVAGFTTSLLKRIHDRLVMLIHPYIEPLKGECHHRKRYYSYPNVALLLQKEADTDSEDIEIITDIYKRFALNLHASLEHVWFTETNNKEEIAHDLSNI